MANKNRELEGAYNDYVTQLQKNKVSARNAIASSTERAKSLLDNRLKAQGLNNSGVGLSQYTALANQQNANLASLNNEYNNNLAQYQQTYNEQMKNEAMSLLPNMSSDKATEYLDSLKQNGNLYSDTTNYLDMYLDTLNNQKSEQSLANAKTELSQLGDYNAIQKYIDNARTSGMSDKDIATLQNYADVLGYGWESTKESYANELAEMMKAVGTGSSEFGRLLSAYQQLNGVKSQDEFNNVMKNLNIDSIIGGTTSNRTALDEYNQIGNMSNGDTISPSTINYWVEQGLFQKKGNQYSTVINGKTYTFDSNGKLIGGGKELSTSNNSEQPKDVLKTLSEAKLNQQFSTDMIKELDKNYPKENYYTTDVYTIGGKQYGIDNSTRRLIFVENVSGGSSGRDSLKSYQTEAKNRLTRA